MQVFGDSAEAALGEEIPDPVLVLEMGDEWGTYPEPYDLETLARIPEWAKPIVQAAFELSDALQAP